MAEQDPKNGNFTYSDYKELREKYRALENRYKDAQYHADTIPVQSIIGLDQKVVQIDYSGKITYINTAMARILGIPRTELKGKEL